MLIIINLSSPKYLIACLTNSIVEYEDYSLNGYINISLLVTKAT